MSTTPIESATTRRRPKGSPVHRAVSALTIAAVVAAGAWYIYQKHLARPPGIVSEEISHQDDLWKADFTARIPAPQKEVFDAIEHIENARSGSIRSVRVLEQHGNSKTVEMEVAGPGGQSITMRLAFQYFPAEGRIVYRTLGNPVLDTTAEYKLAGDGADTTIEYRQATRMLQSFPVPDAVVKQVIRSLFDSQLASLRESLHVSEAEEADADEP
jgi:carbon monoxide dehydrogenase subunit G